MLLYILLPSSTATTIVEKESSIKTMSDADFVTSVPVIPIPIPTWASLIAGASFTPSPVIATIFPLFWSAKTILSLWAGFTLAYTEYLLTIFFSSSSLYLSSSLPSIASLSLSIIPTFFAIAVAVSIESPVIIIGLMPAFLHKMTLFLTLSLGGSIIPKIPAKDKSFSSFSNSLISFGI